MIGEWLNMLENQGLLYKRLMEKSALVDALSVLLVSKGLMTEDEIARTAAKLRMSEEYEYDILTADDDLDMLKRIRTQVMRERIEEYERLKSEGKIS